VFGLKSCSLFGLKSCSFFSFGFDLGSLDTYNLRKIDKAIARMIIHGYIFFL
jgi:hypothetical protein